VALDDIGNLPEGLRKCTIDGAVLAQSAEGIRLARHTSAIAFDRGL
jgi:hypothetical protein